jgi:formylglycine-generating enzyme required for sulfatase activity
MRSLIVALTLALSLIVAVEIGAEEKVPSPVTERDPCWLDSGRRIATGGRKVALLIGASRYATHDGWSLPFVRNDIKLMQMVLGSPGSIGGGFEVKTLQDREVSRDAVESFLTSLGKSLAGSDNLLLIYYSGHGIVQDEERGYYTYHTDLEGDRYSKLLSEGLLSQWVNKLKKEADVKVVLIADACAPTEKGPGRKPTVVEMGDARLYATPLGELAEVSRDREVSAFTGALAETLSDLSAQPRVSLREVFDNTRVRLNAHNPDEGPVLYGSGRDSILLQNRMSLFFTVSAVDGITDASIKGAQVFKSEAMMGETPYRFTDLGEGNYRISVEKEGYQRRYAIVDLSSPNNGHAFEVPLYPKYSILKGQVNRTDGKEDFSGLHVETIGFKGSFVDGHHTASSAIDSSGSFLFYISHDAMITGVRVMSGVRKEAIQQFDKESRTPMDRVREGVVISVYTLERIIVGEVIDRNVTLTRDGKHWHDEARRMVTSGRTEDLDMAIIYYLEAKKGAFGPEKEKTIKALNVGVREAYERMFRYFISQSQYENGILNAEKGAVAFPDDSFYTEWKATFKRENIPASSRALLTESRAALDIGQHKKAEEIYKVLLETGSLTDFYAKSISHNLKEVQAQLFKENLTLATTYVIQNRNADAVEPFLECRRINPSHSIIPVLERKLGGYLDKVPPTLTITNPQGGSIMTRELSYTITGEATDNQEVTRVTVNGLDATLSGSQKKKSFSLAVQLAKGENKFAVEVFDLRGLRTQAAVTINHKEGSAVPGGFDFIGEESFSCGSVSHCVQIYRHTLTGLEFVLLPGGGFEMGSPDAEPGHAKTESPCHRVQVGDFLICRTEVTQKAWTRIMNSQPWKKKKYQKEGEDCSATYVSWSDAVEFCKKAGLRLPSESEWEFACRAGTATAFSFGDSHDQLGSYAWSRANASAVGMKFAHAVGQLKPNAFGLYDMHGNVAEWCRDEFSKSYRDAPDDGSPRERSDSARTARLLRGGTWHHSYASCRSAARLYEKAGARHYLYGFRPAMSVQ